ncbi:ATP-dependent DNA helicase RecG [Nocardioides sp. SYSU D00038]|uniref:ATP-dependent DNA helicase RecG n=1 Tax=Nocardioides sp. SYSU D00038 TaxID=2812554 RepID=UPI0019676AF9|nr:ATP-dependent DNA helicase RecG [Nocardioides sp. SYSU D00038]
MITLESPVESVLGDVGKKKRDRIVEVLGLRTVGDLLGHHPRRYLRTAELTRLDELEEGQLLTLVGEIARSATHTYRDRRTGRTAYRLEAVLRTDGPSLKMTFFAKSQNVAQWQEGRLPPGRRGLFIGKASRFRDEWQLTNPGMILFGTSGEDLASLSLETMGELYPIYPLTAGVDSWDLQRAVSFARTVVDHVPDLVPEAVREEAGLLDARTALDWVHLPADHAQVTRARQRFRFEEALVTQLVLGRRRRAVRALGATPRDGGDGTLLAAFDARLPFTLTEGQRSVGETIEAELARDWPMQRLLQGEVGSGKTLVALRAMLRVVDSGGQAALLAPTEVLAQQHHRSITALMGDLAGGGMLGGAEGATRVELLTGSMTKTQRTEPLLRLATGEAGIVVGTHALLEDQVIFDDLGLVVVDEQHRFGVEQRAALTQKSVAPPHVLVMTATPIPRTVAMTVFGDLETAVLRELPAGRAPIQTTIVPVAEQPHWLGRTWSRVREEVEKGHQVYVVCPRIRGDEQEPGDVDQLEIDDDGNLVVVQGRPGLSAVEDVVADLDAGPLHGLRIAALHGRLPPEEKERVMRAFAAGEVDVLVSTTVIEVGVDVANATTMVILDAERFGVSQLHQLRGRVGRGGLPGLCLLVTRTGNEGGARERLEAVAATTDGFELSRVDLELRREGDVLGASQSGRRTQLHSLRVLRDEETIVAAREAAERLLDDDPELLSHPPLALAVADLEASTRGDFLERS